MIVDLKLFKLAKVITKDLPRAKKKLNDAMQLVYPFRAYKPINDALEIMSQKSLEIDGYLKQYQKIIDSKKR